MVNYSREGPLAPHMWRVSITILINIQVLAHVISGVSVTVRPKWANKKDGIIQETESRNREGPYVGSAPSNS